MIKTEKISLLTANKYLAQKIRLELGDSFEVLDYISEDALLTLVDIDTSARPDTVHVTLSKSGDADIALPLEIGRVAELVSLQKDASPLSLDVKNRTVTLCGESVKLTEIELSLFSLLFEKKGDYASREEILDKVWNNEREPGVINVYIHYLREKLEKNGEKIILSSRLYGYKINEKFFARNAREGGQDA